MSPVVRTLHSRCRGHRFDPWLGNQDPACHAMHAKLLQWCPPLCNPVDCSPPGSSAHGVLQSRILEWVAMPSSRASSQPGDRICVSLQADSLPLSHRRKPCMSRGATIKNKTKQNKNPTSLFHHFPSHHLTQFLYSTHYTVQIVFIALFNLSPPPSRIQTPRKL